MLQNLISRRFQYNRQTRRFFITIIAFGFTFEGMYTVLLNLYLLRLGYDATFIGLLNSIGLLAFAAMSLPAGFLGSRWMSYRMLQLGLGMTFCGTLLLPLSEIAPEGWQGGWLIIMYALVLVGFSVYFVNSSPFLMAVVERKKQKSAFALQTAFLSLAAFFGSLIGGNLPEAISYFSAYTTNDPEPFRYTLLIASFVLLGATLISMKIDESVEQDTIIDDYQQTHLKNTANHFTVGVIMLIILMSVIRFFQVGGVATATIFFNVYLDTQLAMSPGTIGIIAAIGRLIAVPTSVIAPRLMRWRGTGSIAAWASLATAAFIVPFAMVPVGSVAAIAFIGITALSSLRFTAFIVYLMELVPRRQQPVIAGAGEMAAGLSFAVMAWGGGLIITAFSFRDLFLLGAAFAAIGTVLFWLHLYSQAGR